MRAPPLKLFMAADAVGGVFFYALDLARGLAPLGVHTTLAVLGPDMSADQKAMALDVDGLTLRPLPLPLDWLADGPSAVRAAARALADAAAADGADIVHLNMPALAAASYPAPVVGALHSCLATWWAAVKGGPLPLDFLWRTQMLAEGMRRCDALVCPSAAFACEAYAHYGMPMRVVHNGRTAPLILPTRISEARFAFTAGRLWDEGKNIATLDAAAGEIRLPLLAAGPTRGPSGEEAQLNDAVALGLLDASSVRDKLGEGPIFVSAALYEPFGLAVLEAAQAGCPLVLSDIPTFRELWDGAALFAPARDPEGFAAAITAIADDPALYRRLGRAARARARRYRPELMAASMAELYRSLVPAPAARGAASSALPVPMAAGAAI